MLVSARRWKFLPATCLVLGLQWFWRYCFNEPHTSSIRFKLGDSGGVLHQLIPLSWKYFSTCSLQCLGSLSCWNLSSSGKQLPIKGINDRPRIWVYLLASIPVNITTWDAPRDEIPPQIWSLGGSLGHCFNLLGCFFRLKHNFACYSNCQTVHLSENIKLKSHPLTSLTIFIHVIMSISDCFCNQSC